MISPYAAKPQNPRVDWTRSRMRLLAEARRELVESQPFAGHRIGMSLHVEPKTAVLVETLAEAFEDLAGLVGHGLSALFSASGLEGNHRFRSRHAPP